MIRIQRRKKCAKDDMIGCGVDVCSKALRTQALLKDVRRCFGGFDCAYLRLGRSRPAALPQLCNRGLFAHPTHLKFGTRRSTVCRLSSFQYSKVIDHHEQCLVVLVKREITQN